MINITSKFVIMHIAYYSTYILNDTIVTVCMIYLRFHKSLLCPGAGRGFLKGGGEILNELLCPTQQGLKGRDCAGIGSRGRDVSFPLGKKIFKLTLSEAFSDHFLSICVF